MRPRAILLDCLGTLVALEPPAPLLARELEARLGLEVAESEALRGVAAEIAYYREHLDEGRDPATLADLRLRCARALRAAMPVLSQTDDGAILGALLASLRFNAFADSRPALELARAAGRRLVVVSNWDVSLHEVLQRVALAPLLDGIVSSAEEGARKPAPRIFKRALALAGVRAEDAIHVGDSLDEDVAGARAAGIEALLIRRDGAPAPGGVKVIESLLDPKLIGRHER